MEEVFDGRTLTTVMHLLNRGRLRELQGAVKSGKESRIYRGIDVKGGDVAVKIYLTSSAIFRQGRLKYIRGDPRFKDIPHDTRSLIDQWASKEFKNLQLAKEAGLAVPTPIYVEKNVLLPEAREFLKRDIENLNNYFKGLNVRTRSFERMFKVEG